jgi:hypothetical protein
MVRAVQRAGCGRWGQRAWRALLVAHGVLAAACSEPEPPIQTRSGSATSQADVTQSPADECRALREAALEPADAPGFSLAVSPALSIKARRWWLRSFIRMFGLDDHHAVLSGMLGVVQRAIRPFDQV